jgi:hypothetical protein
MPEVGYIERNGTAHRVEVLHDAPVVRGAETTRLVERMPVGQH